MAVAITVPPLLRSCTVTPFRPVSVASWIPSPSTSFHTRSPTDRLPR
jgi:hypothetical protein